MREEFSYTNKRVMLLSGPPGCGKSTLAKVVAEHCGYRAVVINVSEERTATAIIDRIENALSNESIAAFNGPEGSHRKPACLVLDELDGAGDAALVRRISEYLQKGANRERRKRLKAPGGKAKGVEDENAKTADEVSEDENEADGGEETKAPGTQKI